MKVRVKLFAVARERLNRDDLAVELPEHATVADLKCAVVKEFPPLAAILSHALWAVDTAYATDNTTITEKSEVALIPPVSGG